MLKVSVSRQTVRSRQTWKTTYLLLAIAGTIAPWFWLLKEPAVLMFPSLFFQQAFANNVAINVATDLFISAIAFLTLAWIELGRLNQSRWWILFYIALTFGIGLSCGLPFFLYRREAILERDALK